uniref:PHD-type domain-containing protein n=1 Tax=Phytophthora ramorum TaxID=164328 RepID=H3HBH3_PHYRM
MYHGAARDHGDKKRQRLTPPPNEVWMEAIMSKGKAPEGSQQLPEASTGFKGKMAEDYKRERKLPPRVEEMLREQVNLDESVLHDAFAVAMEDLIPEQEANFVAKGLCHLCGAGESHYVPVVNFCPHADEGHSLCREHLRSVYRVRLEALFVGRNGSAPNRRLLRCLVCTSGCPCTSCTQGGTAVVKDNRAPPATPTGPDGRISFSGAPNVASSDSHRYAQYPPTPQGDGRAPVVRGEVSARGVEDGRSWEGHRQIPTQQSDYGQYPAGEPDEEDDEDDEDEGDDSDSELDTNLDFCEVCQGAGDLVCCDKCPRSFHLKCLHMKESDLPEGDWQCAECRKPSRFDLYSTAVASEQGLLDKCLKIVTCLKSHPFSKPFLTPVENIPMYTRVVKQPMDLSTIEDKLKKGAYIVDSNTVAAGVKELDSTHFANDIRLMWSNCKLFNDDGSGITRAADILSAGFERLYKESIEPPLTTAEFPESLLVVSVAMELALDEEGAQVTAVTSYDPNFPPVNILDGEQSSKWVTTGSFPQELVVQLATTASVVRAKMWTRNVKEVSVEACSGPTPTKWEKLFDAKLKETDGEMQIVSENVKPTDASFIKFRILSGWGDFVQVHRVSVEGSTSRR